MFYLILFISNLVFATELPDVELIDNQTIIDDVGHCSQEVSEKPPFYFTYTSNPKSQPWHENLRSKGNKSAPIIGQVAIGSAVEIDANFEDKVGARSYVGLTVLQQPSPREKLSDPVTGSAQGYFYGRSLDYPENWDIKIQSSRMKGNISEEDAQFLNGKALRTHKTAQGYHLIECCRSNKCETFPVFSVRANGATNALAYISFNPSEMGFINKFESVRVGPSAKPLNLEVTARKSQLSSTQTNSSSQYDGESKKEGRHAHASVAVATQQKSKAAAKSQSKLILESSLRPTLRPEAIESGQNFLSSLFFPINRAPIKNFTEGMRRFGASRSGGTRKHAGCDLYHPLGEAVRAVKGGQVLRRYHFYLGTYAVEVKNKDGTVIRYGELSGRNAPGIKPGALISAGDTVGYIGRLNGLKNTMLHFEEFRGTASGALTQANNPPYKRRKDLQDPTPLLVSLGKKEGVLR